LRNISDGVVVKEKTWQEYASDFVDALIRSSLFPLQQDDREHLMKSFHSYRRSYEQLNEMLSRVQASREILQRAVLRLQFQALGIRYAALCLWTGMEPSRNLPSWAEENGANEFWRALVKRRFPDLALVGGKQQDCSSEAEMAAGQMKHCLYDNAYPGADCLKRLLPDASERAQALRHYCAYELCRELARHFGQREVASWVRGMMEIGACLVDFIRLLDHQVPENQHRDLVWSMFSEGIGSPAVAEFIKRFADKIPIHIARTFWP